MSNTNSTIKLRFLKSWRILGWSIVAFAWYVTLDPSPPDLSVVQFGDKLVHTTAYFGMMLWLSQCYEKKHHLALAVFFVLMGVSLEFLQGWSGYRTFEIADMFANSLGVLIGWVITYTTAGRLFYKIDNLISR